MYNQLNNERTTRQLAARHHHSILRVGQSVRSFLSAKNNKAAQFFFFFFSFFFMPRSNVSDMGNFGIAYYDGGQDSDLIDVDYGDLSALRTEWNFGEYLVLVVSVIFLSSVFGFLAYTCYREGGGGVMCRKRVGLFSNSVCRIAQ